MILPRTSQQLFRFFEMMKQLLMLLGLVMLTHVSQAQNRDSLVQFSGVVVSGDSLSPVPFTSILIKGTNRGTITDFYGYFSIVAKKRDIIQFSCVGYKTSEYKIPDTLKNDRYSLIQILTSDTINLPVASIYPWPSIEDFKLAFMNLEIPDDDLERARKNLDQAEMCERMEATPMDGALNYKYQMNLYSSQLYYAGQAPPINLLNPLAWAKFIKAWRRGDFRRRKDK